MIERYLPKDIGDLFSDESRFNAYLQVEIEATHAFSELGVVPKEEE